MEIKIGNGCNNIVFGMSEKNVKNVLGEPNKEYCRYISSGCNHKVYQYNDLMIAPIFHEEENFKLYTIEVYNTNIRLWDFKLFNKNMEEVTSFLISKGYTTLENESYETFDTLYCDELNINFAFEFNRLTNASFSPLWNNDNILWPKSL